MSPAPERLSLDDARILGLESAAITGHTCKVAIVEPPPDGRAIGIEELRSHVAARLGRVRRCRQRVALVPLGLGRPVWVDCPDFDIREHVRRYDSDGVIDRARLLRIAAELMAERLDHTRPLWQMDLVGPLEDGGSAIVWRIHHCMADGVTATRLGGQILWESEPDPASPEAEPWRPEPEPSPLRLIFSGIEERAGEAGRSIAGLARDATSPGRWGSSARSLGRLPGSLIRELTPLGSSSPLDRHIGRRRELAFASRPLDELHRIAKAVGDKIGSHVTINDVVLASISGAIRHWGVKHDATERLRAQVPVSMHHRDERPDALGNRDSFLFVDLPVDEPDPMRRVELINSETTVRKAAHDAEALYTFFHAMSRLGPAGHEIVRAASGPREFGLSVSNVPGPREPIYLLGGRVAELCSIAEPADRHALRVSALSCAGTMHFGLCTDPDALAGLGTVATGIDDAIDELGERC
ncbi:MAG TPA: wax ester/triacylglycerol synthase family O-acyltransferase [Solirubrobacterales bacterium]|nr:wax ester/triacylglycerol synthase family O-acyltransferase [Solirubrobacterales bacterium]